MLTAKAALQSLRDSLAEKMGPLPPDVLARLDALYESDFNSGKA